MKGAREGVRVANTDLDAKVQRIVGESCWVALNARMVCFMVMRTDPEFRAPLNDRPQADLVKDLRRAQELTLELDALLKVPDVRYRLAAAVHGLNGQAEPQHRSPAKAMREVDQLHDTILYLHAYAETAAAAIKLRPGKSPDRLRVGYVKSVAQCLAIHGHTLGTGSNSRLVRVLTTTWPRMHYGGDARDTLRRLVDSGAVDLRAIEAESQRFRATNAVDGDALLSLDPWVQMADPIVLAMLEKLPRVQLPEGA